MTDNPFQSLPSAHYRCLVLDPPWDGREKGFRGREGVRGYDVNAASHYSTMTVADIDAIGRMAIEHLAANPFHLWLWTIDLFLDDALSLLQSWGLSRKRTHIWVKTTSTLRRTMAGLESYTPDDLLTASRVMASCGITGKPNPRTGHWGKLGHEYLILATRDNSCRTLNATREPSVFFGPVTSHSSKPDEAYQLIARNSPGPRISLFERRARVGFDGWGDQYHCGVAP